MQAAHCDQVLVCWYIWLTFVCRTSQKYMLKWLHSSTQITFLWRESTLTMACHDVDDLCVCL